MLILGGQHGELLPVEHKLAVVSGVLVLKLRKCLAVFDLDVFISDFALISFPVGKSESVTPNLTHFENTDRVPITLPVHYL